MSGYTDQVRNTIEQIPENQIFQASTVWQENLMEVPEKTYYKSLERLTKYGELMHLTKGLYYRPKQEEDEMIPLTDEDIINYYTENLSGMVIGYDLYVRNGIAEEKDFVIEVLSNRVPDKQKHVGNITVQKAELDLNEDTIAVIEVLEILQNFHKLEKPNRGRFLARVRDFAETYDEQITRYVLEHRKYKKSTIAFLRQLLQFYHVENGLDYYLSSLSEYKIPKMEDLRQEIPPYVMDKLKQYVKELEKIYGKHLQNVLLYGSYARGDYTEESDIDIMILADMRDDELEKFDDELSALTFEFNMGYDLEIMPFVKDKTHFMKWVVNYPFYANVWREGVRMYGAA